MLLWRTMSGRLLTRASYDSLGRDGRSGLAVAMATKADATLASLPPKKRSESPGGSSCDWSSSAKGGPTPVASSA